MNKKANTALFIIGATLLNMLLIFLFIFLFIILAGLLFPNPSEGAVQVMFLMIFILAMGGSFGVYHLIIKLISKKIDMDKYFHPVFRPRRRK